MPHCIIEYAIELEQENSVKEIVQIINQDLITSNLFDNNTIKTRAIPVTTYLVGEKQNLFLHITLKLLKGRTTAQKQILAEKILKTLSNKFNMVDDITLEIIDLDPDFYFKKE